MTRATLSLTLLATGTLLLAGLPAFAAGGGSGGDAATPTCKKGEIYNQVTGKCEKKSASNVTDKNRADYAYALAKAERYDEALEVLDEIKNQNDPEVLNYRGYATRKLGRTDEGISYYLKSVALDPHYVKVREYLGEAYVIKGRLDLAKEQLATIQSLCGNTQCEEYEDLADAIEHPSKS